MNLDSIGASWLAGRVGSLTDEINSVLPSDFNEENRYLPESVTSIPGYIRYDINPFMREIVDCFHVDSPVREVSLMKGVQITYTTALESGMLYNMAHVKTSPMMYITADKELAQARIENNILPMLIQSGFKDIIRSSDEGNSRKTGSTKSHMQWAGGGYMVPFGAKNADKMRSFSIQVMLKDEIDAWPDFVGKDGCPDTLSDARCEGFWDRRKIFRGSTPLLKANSKIYKAYLKGDQRKYMVRCKHCDFPQFLRWNGKDEKTDKEFGFAWDMKDGVLDLDSVRYLCENCHGEHFEYDKEKLFSPDYGAKWEPTSKPVAAGIRSYHLPSLYSPIGMKPWSKCVLDYLDSYDPVGQQVKDFKKYQVFYNNTLAWPIEEFGGKIRFAAVSAHRKHVYKFGQIPNEYSREWSGGNIQFLTCSVDVHKSFLAVAVIGWTPTFCSYVIDYFRWEDDDCYRPESKVWEQLRELIDDGKYRDNENREYLITMTLIDSNGVANDVVCRFCNEYTQAVFPIIGQPTPNKSARISEFSEFSTQVGSKGYKITVDHYKDRLAPVMRRDWVEDSGQQRPYHFNAPTDITDKQLKELTVEIKREETDKYGRVSYNWYRPSGARNELWDLMVYNSAAVEIMAWQICVKTLEQETVNWDWFWSFLDKNPLYTIIDE